MISGAFIKVGTNVLLLFRIWLEILLKLPRSNLLAFKLGLNCLSIVTLCFSRTFLQNSTPTNDSNNCSATTLPLIDIVILVSMICGCSIFGATEFTNLNNIDQRSFLNTQLYSLENRPKNKTLQMHVYTTYNSKYITRESAPFFQSMKENLK